MLDNPALFSLFAAAACATSTFLAIALARERRRRLAVEGEMRATADAGAASNLALQRAHDLLSARVAELEGAEVASAAQAEADAEGYRVRVEELAARLAYANAELETFSYSVSHDLRAPLRSIAGFSRELMLGYTEKLDERGVHYLTRIREAATRMAELIDDLLDLARLSRQPMKRADVDVSALARRVAENLAEVSGSNVEVRIEPHLTASADATLLRIVFENLIGNAMKFSARTGQAIIEIGSERGALYVRDNGVGFDPAHASRLFTPFERLHSREFEGTGIGLALVHRIVQRHGGRIWAESSPGDGATFRFTLGDPRPLEKAS